MAEQIVTSTKKEFDNILFRFENEISKLNIGRANIALVEDMPVKYYGSTVPLKQTAQLAIPDPKTITVQPWDKTVLAEIENAINNSELNLRAINDGIKVSVSLPPLTEERRTELSKVIKAREEESRVALRNIRQKVWEDVQEKVKKSELTEDDKYHFEDELNKLIEEYNKKIDDAALNKTEEIMKV